MDLGSHKVEHPSLPGHSDGLGRFHIDGKKPLNILVIEDDLDTAATTLLMLRLWGYEGRAVHGGRDALAACQQRWPDAVLLDIGLPGMDGMEIARRISAQRDGKGRKPFLVAISGYARPEDVARSRSAGFDSHLAKPVTLAGLQGELAGGRGRGEPVGLGGCSGELGLGLGLGFGSSAAASCRRRVRLPTKSTS